MILLFLGQYQNSGVEVWVWKETPNANFEPYKNPVCAREWFGNWTMISLAPWVGRYGFAILNLEKDFDPEVAIRGCGRELRHAAAILLINSSFIKVCQAFAKVDPDLSYSQSVMEKSLMKVRSDQDIST